MPAACCRGRYLAAGSLGLSGPEDILGEPSDPLWACPSRAQLLSAGQVPGAARCCLEACAGRGRPGAGKQIQDVSGPGGAGCWERKLRPPRATFLLLPEHRNTGSSPPSGWAFCTGPHSPVCQRGVRGSASRSPGWTSLPVRTHPQYCPSLQH